MAAKTVNIPSISCHHCLMTIKREVSEISGVQSVEGSVEDKRVTIRWEEPADWGKIEAALKDAGYPPQ